MLIFGHIVKGEIAILALHGRKWAVYRNFDKRLPDGPLSTSDVLDATRGARDVTQDGCKGTAAFGLALVGAMQEAIDHASDIPN